MIVERISEIPGAETKTESPTQSPLEPRTEAEANELLVRASWKAIARLEGILNDTGAKDAAVVAAAKEILDRERGKPSQSVQIQKNVRHEISFSFMDGKADLIGQRDKVIDNENQ